MKRNLGRSKGDGNDRERQQKREKLPEWARAEDIQASGQQSQESVESLKMLQEKPEAHMDIQIEHEQAEQYKPYLHGKAKKSGKKPEKKLVSKKQIKKQKKEDNDMENDLIQDRWATDVLKGILNFAIKEIVVQTLDAKVQGQPAQTVIGFVDLSKDQFNKHADQLKDIIQGLVTRDNWTRILQSTQIDFTKYDRVLDWLQLGYGKFMRDFLIQARKEIFQMLQQGQKNGITFQQLVTRQIYNADFPRFIEAKKQLREFKVDFIDFLFTGQNPLKIKKLDKLTSLGSEQTFIMMDHLKKRKKPARLEEKDAPYRTAPRSIRQIRQSFTKKTVVLPPPEQIIPVEPQNDAQYVIRDSIIDLFKKQTEQKYMQTDAGKQAERADKKKRGQSVTESEPQAAPQKKSFVQQLSQAIQRRRHRQRDSQGQSSAWAFDQEAGEPIKIGGKGKIVNKKNDHPQKLSQVKSSTNKKLRKKIKKKTQSLLPQIQQKSQDQQEQKKKKRKKKNPRKESQSQFDYRPYQGKNPFIQGFKHRNIPPQPKKIPDTNLVDFLQVLGAVQQKQPVQQPHHQQIQQQPIVKQLKQNTKRIVQQIQAQSQREKQIQQKNLIEEIDQHPNVLQQMKQRYQQNLQRQLSQQQSQMVRNMFPQRKQLQQPQQIEVQQPQHQKSMVMIEQRQQYQNKIDEQKQIQVYSKRSSQIRDDLVIQMLQQKQIQQQQSVVSLRSYQNIVQNSLFFSNKKFQRDFQNIQKQQPEQIIQIKAFLLSQQCAIDRRDVVANTIGFGNLFRNNLSFAYIGALVSFQLLKLNQKLDQQLLNFRQEQHSQIYIMQTKQLISQVLADFLQRAFRFKQQQNVTHLNPNMFLMQPTLRPQYRDVQRSIKSVYRPQLLQFLGYQSHINQNWRIIPQDPIQLNNRMAQQLRIAFGQGLSNSFQNQMILQEAQISQSLLYSQVIPDSNIQASQYMKPLSQKQLHMQQFPFIKVIYLLMLQCWYRLLNTLRWSKRIINQQQQQQPVLGQLLQMPGDQQIIRFKNLLQYCQFQLVLVPQMSKISQPQKRWALPIRKKGQRFNYKYYQQNLFFYGFPLVKQSNTLKMNIQSFFQFLYDQAQKFYYMIQQQVSQKIYRKYQVQKMNSAWVIKHLQIRLSPVYDIRQVVPNTSRQSFLTFYKIITQDMQPQLQGVVWRVFNPIKKLCYQSNKYRDWCYKQKNIQQTKCYFLVIKFLYQNGAISSQTSRDCVHNFKKGKLRQVIDILHNSKIGHFYSGALGMFQIGESGWNLYIDHDHVSIIQSADIQKMLHSSNGSTALSCTSQPQLQLDKWLQMQKCSQRSEKIFDKLQKHVDNKRRQLHHKNSPKLFPFQSKFQYPLRQRCLFVDIQAYAQKQVVQTCYLVCVVGYLNDLSSQVCWDFFDNAGGNAIKAFFFKLKWQMDHGNYTKQKPLTIWTFNGNKYQMTFFFPYLLKYFGAVKILGQVSDAKAYSCCQQSLVFRDLRTLIPSGSLNQLSNQTYKTIVSKTKKQAFDITTITNQLQVQNHKQKIIQYCRDDCFALMYVYFKFFINMKNLCDQLYQSQKKIHCQHKGIHKITVSQLLKCITAPSIALLIFKKIFLKNNIVDNQPMQWKLIQRQNYFGGISQVTRHQINQQCYSFDINSSYPCSMTKPLPWFFVQRFKEQRIKQFVRQGRYPQLGYFKVRAFKFHKNSYNFIPYRSNKGLIYPGQISKSSCLYFYLWGFQINQILRTGGTVLVQDGVLYSDTQDGKKCVAMKQYVQKIYPMKQKQKDKARKSLIKLLLNSLYGKFGQRQFQNHTAFHPQYAKVMGLFQQFTIDQTTIIQTQDYTSQYSKIGGFHIGQFVRIASCITALSRLSLAKVCTLIGMSNVYYVDTDSITTNLTGRSIMQKNNLLDDKSLGLWKQQNCYISGYFLAPKNAILVANLKFNDQKFLKQCLKTKYGLLSVKWKGLPKRLITVQNIQLFYKFVQKTFQYFDKQPQNVLVMVPYALPIMMPAQRWKKTKVGIRIQSFKRQTSIIFKRIYRSKGYTQSLTL